MPDCCITTCTREATLNLSWPSAIKLDGRYVGAYCGEHAQHVREMFTGVTETIVIGDLITTARPTVVGLEPASDSTDEIDTFWVQWLQAHLGQYVTVRGMTGVLREVTPAGQRDCDGELVPDGSAGLYLEGVGTVWAREYDLVMEAE